MSVGEKVNDYLKQNGISQTFISIKTGIPLPKLNLALNGNRRLTFEEYQAICYVLKLSTGTFIEAKPLEDKAGTNQ